MILPENAHRFTSRSSVYEELRNKIAGRRFQAMWCFVDASGRLKFCVAPRPEASDLRGFSWVCNKSFLVGMKAYRGDTASGDMERFTFERGRFSATPKRNMV